MSKRLLLAFLTLFGATSVAPAQGQILDTLGGFDPQPGWQGRLSAQLKASGGNSEVQDYAAGAKTQWETGRHRVRTILGYSRSSSEGVETGESATAHLRHNLRLGRGLSTLAFGQLQSNPFQDLELRELLGAGLRWDVAQSDRSEFALGISGMLEFETLEGSDGTQVSRLSAFVDFSRELREGVDVSATVFHQPRFDRFADARTSVSAELRVALVGALALKSSFALSRDSDPPRDVENVDWTLLSGLSLDL